MKSIQKADSRPRPGPPVAPARGGPPIYVPVALLLVVTALIRAFNLDLWFGHEAYDPRAGWTLDTNGFVQLLYRYGTWPAITVACIAGVVWVASVFHDRLSTHRQLAMFVALSMALGPGLVVNGIFKEYYGRPRPVQVTEFGGERQFAPVWEPHFGEDGKSFPSGHASMGFFWLTFAVFYAERNRRLAVAFALLALVHGACMGFARIVQGGHWFSDVIWAAGMDYLTAWFLYRALKMSPSYSGAVPDDRQPTGS
jgi:lipid A 4'-phosphatase